MIELPPIRRRDEDGCAIYDNPRGQFGWDLDAPPEEMGDKALCAAVARDLLGCKVEWWGYYCDWVCDCPGAVHGCDSQCSQIPGPMTLRRHVLALCDERGIALLAVADDLEQIRAALVAWRATG